MLHALCFSSSCFATRQGGLSPFPCGTDKKQGNLCSVSSLVPELQRGRACLQHRSDQLAAGTCSWDTQHTRAGNSQAGGAQVLGHGAPKRRERDYCQSLAAPLGTWLSDRPVPLKASPWGVLGSGEAGLTKGVLAPGLGRLRQLHRLTQAH